MIGEFSGMQEAHILDIPHLAATLRSQEASQDSLALYIWRLIFSRISQSAVPRLAPLLPLESLL